jgi:hypothetical protein
MDNNNWDDDDGDDDDDDGDEDEDDDIDDAVDNGDDDILPGTTGSTIIFVLFSWVFEFSETRHRFLNTESCMKFPTLLHYSS